MPFSKGTRQCGGINLAWVELYVGLASLVRRFELLGTEKGEAGKRMEQREFL